MAKRRQNAHGGVHACEQIGHGHPYFLGAAAQVIALTRDAHQATNALHRVVITGAIAVGARLAKTCDAAVNQFGVQGFEAGVVQAITRHVADLEVFDEDVAMHHQFFDQGLTIGLRNIARK